MDKPLWDVVEGEGPIVAAAIHHGHCVRREVADLLALADEARAREEDPYTGGWTDIAETRIVVNVSRFEMDLNRPRGKAVYLEPEDAWGLEVWRSAPPPSMLAASLEQYDAFYRMAQALLSRRVEKGRRFVVLDLHTYNHRRNGPSEPPAPVEENPEVNVGTGTLDRRRWGRVVERFIHDLRDARVLGRGLDVRENVKFRGGNFSRWVNERFPDAGCSLAIEIKKVFMDEWTGEVDTIQFGAIRDAFQATLPGIREELARMAPGD